MNGEVNLVPHHASILARFNGCWEALVANLVNAHYSPATVARIVHFSRELAASRGSVTIIYPEQNMHDAFCRLCDYLSEGKCTRPIPDGVPTFSMDSLESRAFGWQPGPVNVGKILTAQLKQYF